MLTSSTTNGSAPDAAVKVEELQRHIRHIEGVANGVALAEASFIYEAIEKLIREQVTEFKRRLKNIDDEQRRAANVLHEVLSDVSNALKEMCEQQLRMASAIEMLTDALARPGPPPRKPTSRKKQSNVLPMVKEQPHKT